MPAGVPPPSDGVTRAMKPRPVGHIALEKLQIAHAHVDAAQPGEEAADQQRHITYLLYVDADRGGRFRVFSHSAKVHADGHPIEEKRHHNNADESQPGHHALVVKYLEEAWTNNRNLVDELRQLNEGHLQAGQCAGIATVAGQFKHDGHCRR